MDGLQPSNKKRPVAPPFGGAYFDFLSENQQKSAAGHQRWPQYDTWAALRAAPKDFRTPATKGGPSNAESRSDSVIYNRPIDRKAVNSIMNRTLRVRWVGGHLRGPETVLVGAPSRRPAKRIG